MAGKKVNKNSTRGSGSLPGGKGGMQIGADITIIKPLNNGQHAYVLNATNGKMFHGRTDSQAFADVLAANAAAGYEARMRAELGDYAERFPADGWDATLARFEASLVAEDVVEETVNA